MSEDKELEILKQKKIKELMERIENKNKPVNPKNILISRLVDRGDEVLRIAETYYPKETERIVNQLIEMIKNGKINNSSTLVIVQVLAIVIQNGMNILGVSLPKKM